MPFEGIAFTIVPLLIAIRVIRGFPGSRAAAALAFAGAHVIALIALVQGGHPRPVQFSAAVGVALALSATGLGMVGLDWFVSRQSRRRSSRSGRRSEAPPRYEHAPDRASIGVSPEE